MRFKFPFLTLLKQRKVEEELARRDFLTAQSKVNEQLAKINGMWSEIEEAREKAAQLQHNGGRTTVFLSFVDSFICGQLVRIERSKDSLRELMMVAEQKREILVEAAKQYKILQKLEERQVKAFNAKKKKKEMKDIDNMVVMRFQRGVR